MSYTSGSFVADEQPTTAKWNLLWANDASFNDGSGIGDNAILNRHVSEGVIASEKLNATVAFHAYASGATTLVDANATKVLLATEIYDYGSDFASSTFTAPVDGVYSFCGSVVTSAISSHSVANIRIYKNGSPIAYGGTGTDAAGYVANIKAELLLDATDTIELYFFHNSGGDETTATGEGVTWFAGHLVGEV